MPNYQPVTVAQHAEKRWQRYTNYAHAAGDAIAPLVVQELQKAILSLPIAFVPQGERYLLVAVLGLADGKNLFIAPDGRWLAGYTPAALRGYPFALANTEDGQQVLCVDADSPLVGTDGEAFFNADGTPSQPVSDVLNFLSQVANNRAATERLCDLLQQHQIIQPWPIKVQSETGEYAVAGLYRIDEAALNQLPAEAFIELRDNGALVLAYCQLLSMQHLPMLGNLAQLHTQAVQQATPSTTPQGDLDLEFLNNSGTISFGNLH
ncbi:MAG: SapC family protein [Rhodocyclaceae bacterium]|nr:SapC family protein [Rhodocyclaceae bacterium]